MAAAEWPGAAQVAAWYARFAEAVASRSEEAVVEPLHLELQRYLTDWMRATGLGAIGASGSSDLRSLLAPIIERAEVEYQAWARSPLALEWIGRMTAAIAAVPAPTVDPLAGTLRAFSHSWGLAAQTTPCAEVWREGSLRLFRYGAAKAGSGPALVLLYAQINRPSILDLEPGRSLIQGLVEAGRDVYLLDWGEPQPEDHERTLAQLLQGPLHRALKAVSSRRKVDLLGVCQGGVIALLYAAIYPQRVRRMVTMVTPVDFQTPDDLLSLWARACAPAALHARQFSSGSALNLLFQMLAPFRQGVGKYLDLSGHLNDPDWVQRFRRMERWVHDCPDPPYTILRTFVEDLYRENRLLRNTLRLDGRHVDLRNVRAPLLNIYGTKDHIVPPASSRALTGLTGSRRYEEWALPVGHIGIFVSTQAATLPARIAAWLKHR